MRKPHMKWHRIGLLAACAGWFVLLTSGCGPSGPPRYQVSGAVTYGGEPIPAGRVFFEPDESKGNVGPIGTAVINGGRYETRSGEGPIGGPHVVIINGHDGIPDPVEPDETPMGRTLFFPYKTHVDLPKEASTQDFDVPVQPER